MTSITLTVKGAKAQASVSGHLTSGMVGIPVTIEYDDAWNGLTKNLVCRCGKWGPEKGETRTILNIGESTTVAHEVLKPNMHLYLGIEGYSTNEKMVMPTTWADCGLIWLGATSNEDPSANPELPIWAQLQWEIRQIKDQIVTEEQIAASVAAYLEENPIEVPEAPQNPALNAVEVTSLDNMFKICAFTKADVSAEYSAFKTVFGITDSGDSGGDSGGAGEDSGETEKTLDSISATYSGGDVAVGTAVTDLTGIAVTAHYSDGTSEAVTGYTLSGTIAEGSNTVTVTYQGKTATFIVTGVAESGGGDDSGGEETGVSNENMWTDGVAYTYTLIENEYVESKDGSFTDYATWNRTPYLKCDGASKLSAVAKVSGSTLLTTDGNTTYNAFYDRDKSFISAFSFKFPSDYAVGDCVDIEVPANAVYFIISGPRTSIGTDNLGKAPIVDFIPYA